MIPRFCTHCGKELVRHGGPIARGYDLYSGSPNYYRVLRCPEYKESLTEYSSPHTYVEVKCNIAGTIEG